VAKEHVSKLRDILARLDASGAIEIWMWRGFRLHTLKGDFQGCWAVTVNANWRVLFRFADGNAHDIDYLDYH
jgi:proteic killer suppression protein